MFLTLNHSYNIFAFIVIDRRFRNIQTFQDIFAYEIIELPWSWILNIIPCTIQYILQLLVHSDEVRAYFLVSYIIFRLNANYPSFISYCLDQSFHTKSAVFARLIISSIFILYTHLACSALNSPSIGLRLTVILSFPQTYLFRFYTRYAYVQYVFSTILLDSRTRSTNIL